VRRVCQVGTMATIGTMHRSQTRSRRLRDYFSWPYRQMDYGLVLAVLALVAVGLIMVYSASLYVGLYFQGSADYYFRRQFVGAVLGVAGIFVLLTLDYHFIRRASTYVMLGTLALHFVVLVAGDTLLGARRGLYQGSFQPSELAKLVTIFYVADWLSSKGDRIKDFSMGLVPFVVVVGIVGGLIAVQPDLSTAMLIVLIGFTMFFIAGARWSHFISILLVGILAFVFLINVFPHAAERWDDYVTMLQDPGEVEWHTKQVFYGLARGGLFGQGLGNSFQKTGPLPVPHSDSILAVIGEELGLVGCLLVLALLGFIGSRGYRIVMKTADPYGQMLALGVTSWLVYQALVNAAVIAGIIPFTGLPLPFVSYGGSSMMVSLWGVGVLLNISQQNRKLEAGLARQERRKSAAAGLGRRDRRTHLPRASHRR
jgi:cell division protein FtsW